MVWVRERLGPERVCERRACRVLGQPSRQPKRRRLWLSDGSCICLRSTHRITIPSGLLLRRPLTRLGKRLKSHINLVISIALHSPRSCELNPEFQQIQVSRDGHVQKRNFCGPLSLSPGHADAHQYRFLLQAMGRFDEAMTEFKRLFRLIHLHPAPTYIG